MVKKNACMFGLSSDCWILQGLDGGHAVSDQGDAILVFTQELRIVNASISAWKIVLVLHKDTDCSWSEFKIAWSSIAGSTNAPAPTTSSLAEPSA